MLSATNLPKFTGLESFEGKWYHTSQWPHEGVDFTAKRVGVVGTGATAVQAIPEIAQQAKHLTVFQRTPGFCVPARNGKVDPAVVKARKADYDGIVERIRHSYFGFELNFIEKSVLEASPEERAREFEARWDTGGFGFWLGNYQDMFFDKEANDLCADYLKRKIRATVKDPVVAEKLIPKYAYGTKRQPLDTNYYETFNKDNVLLVDASDAPIEEITPKGIRAGGKEHKFDIIVFATGFDAMTGPLTRIKIQGRGGQCCPRNGRTARLPTSAWRSPASPTCSRSPALAVLRRSPTCRCRSNSMSSGSRTASITCARTRPPSKRPPKREDQWTRTWPKWPTRRSCPAPTLGTWGRTFPARRASSCPILAGVGLYRQKCNEIAEQGYEGFVLA